LPPQVACPHNVDNVVDVGKVEGKRIDQVFLGSCTNGRFEDLKIAADVMDGRPVAKGVRMIVIPASHTEYMKALGAGLVEEFMNAARSWSRRAAARAWAGRSACWGRARRACPRRTVISGQAGQPGRFRVPVQPRHGGGVGS